MLWSTEKHPGHHAIIFDAKELSSGIYFYTIRTDGFTQSKKMILIKSRNLFNKKSEYNCSGFLFC